MKEEYKDSIIGLIPNEWYAKKLNTISLKITDGSHYSPIPTSGTGYYIATVKDMRLKDFNPNSLVEILESDYKNLIRNGCKPEENDILFSKDGTIGKSFVFNGLQEVVVLSSIAIIKLRHDIALSNYVCQVLKSFIFDSQLEGLKSGSALKRLVLKSINEIKVPLPPLPEQQKIADILTTVDDKLENIESQIAEYSNLKTGLMQQLLTKGIGHSKFVDSKLGMIPEGWRVVILGEIGSTYNGLSGKSKDDFGNGEPYIPYMNIFSNNTINPNWLEYVSISPDENQNAVKYGDVFFTTSSETPEEVGMSSVLLDDIGTAYLNSFCFGFRLNDFNALLPDYAKFLFRGQAVRKSIVVFAQGSTRFNLSKTNLLKRLHLALPPISEQKEIANILTSVDEKLKSLLQKKEEYIKLKKGLMEQLLTGRIRVKV